MARQNCESKPQSLTPTSGREKRSDSGLWPCKKAPSDFVTKPARLGGLDSSWLVELVLDVASQLARLGSCRACVQKVLLCAPSWHQLPGFVPLI